MSETTINPSVALVDDDESMCQSLSRLLRAADYGPVAYHSAEAFLDDPDHDRFDCLILDLQLRGMSGVELSAQLAASGSTTPVIFITAHDEPDLREEALRIGCVAYLRKSDPRETVLAALSLSIHQPTINLTS